MLRGVRERGLPAALRKCIVGCGTWAKSHPEVAAALVAVMLSSARLFDGLSGDEIATYRWAVLHEPILTTGEPAGPLWLEVTLPRWGALLVGKLWGLRLPSLAFALGSIAVGVDISRRLWGERGAVVAALLIGCSPFLAEFAVEARPYAIMAFCGALLYWGFFRFLDCESHSRALVLGAVAALSLLGRNIFIASLTFYALYYLIAKRGRATWQAVLAAAIPVPVLAWSLWISFLYMDKAPKVPGGGMLGLGSLVNLALRSMVAFNFGYSTLRVPPLGVTRDVSTFSVLSGNLCVGLLALTSLIGASCLVLMFLCSEHGSGARRLAWAAAGPPLIILAIGAAGYTIPREKYLIGSLIPYLVLLAGAVQHGLRARTAVLVAAAYSVVVAVSLFHGLVEPHTYSRRAFSAELVEHVVRRARPTDSVVAYGLSGLGVPGTGYDVLDGRPGLVVVARELEKGATLCDVARLVSSNTTGRIFLIDAEGLRNWLDPDDTLRASIETGRQKEVTPYGRNLRLVVLSEPAYGQGRGR